MGYILMHPYIAVTKFMVIIGAGMSLAGACLLAKRFWEFCEEQDALDASLSRAQRPHTIHAHPSGEARKTA